MSTALPLSLPLSLRSSLPLCPSPGVRARRAAAGLVVAWAAATPGWVQAQAAAQPLPTAPVRNVPEVFFGTTVDDPYRDFEDIKAPAVAAWMKAHSDHALAVLRGISGRGALRDKLEMYDSSTAARVVDVVRLRGELYFYQRRGPQDDQFKLYMRRGLQGAEKLLFDPERLHKKTGQPHAINYYAPSPDGRRVAIGVSAGGSEEAALRVLDTANGRQIGPEISRALYGAVSWTPDSKQLFFHRAQAMTPGMPATDKYSKGLSVRMKPGAGERGIVTVLQGGVGDAVKSSPTETPVIDVQPDGRVIAQVIDGVSNEFRAYASTLDRVLAGKPDWRLLFDTEDGVTAMAVQGNRLYVLTHKGAPRYKLLSGPLDGFSMAEATTLVPESARVLTGMAAAADALYLEARDGNVKRLFRLLHLDGARPVEVALPVIGAFSLGGGVRADLPGVLLDLESWTRARQIYAVAADGRVSNTGLQPAGPYDAPGNVVADEVMVKSHDGVMVPMSIIHKAGVTLDGNNPTMLYGYASYGITEEPFFSISRLAWMDAGGVFAVANPRGSGVFGKQWHEDGRLTKKPNTWLDFIACAEYLVAQKWTRPQRLAIWGGSAGGILVGRAMTDRPDLFAVVIPDVGELDTIRAETTPNGPPNIPEFGTRTTEAGFRGLLAMSTYAHIQDGVDYPAVLFVHGVNDPRVDVWNSTKTAARLMAATRSGKPVLLRLEYDSGHGIGSTKGQVLDERADVFAFTLWQMGVPGYAVKKP
jgi:prolyl oligopeptidase